MKYSNQSEPNSPDPLIAELAKAHAFSAAKAASHRLRFVIKRKPRWIPFAWWTAAVSRVLCIEMVDDSFLELIERKNEALKLIHRKCNEALHEDWDEWEPIVGVLKTIRSIASSAWPAS